MFRHLDQIWRIIGCGLGFILFGLGGLAASLTIFPIIALGIREERRRQRAVRRVIQWMFRGFIAYVVGVRVIDLELHGMEKLAQCKGTVVVSNHPTLIDIILIIAVLPDAQCVVKNQLWRNPFLGGVVRSAGYIRNDDDPEAVLLSCVRTLQSGGNLLVFPEGTRTRDRLINRFHRGFANIAMRAGADIQCLSLTCRPLMLAKHMAWYQLPRTRTRVTLTVGERVEAGAYVVYPSPLIGARRITKSLETTYLRLLAHG